MSNRLCAVAGCDAPGRSQRCPHDGRRHSHGRVHYGSLPASSLTFRDGWHWLCPEHFTIVAAERAAWSQGVAYGRENP